MSSPTSGATIRADINTVVEEAAAAEKFFIGSRAMPPYPVSAKSGQYPKLQIAAAELMRGKSTIRSRASSYNRISRQWTTDSYDCLDRGLEEPVDDTDQADLARYFNAEAAAARLTYRNMMIDYEDRVATEVMNATNFGAGTNSAVAYTEANIATISLIADILDAIERVRDNGQNPNTIIMGSKVWNRCRRATPTLTFVSGQIGAGSKVTVNTLQAALADEGIEQVLIGRARKQGAIKGAAHSASAIWGTTYVWVGVVNQSANDMKEGGAGFSLYWNAEGGLFVSETYRDENIRSNIVRVRQNVVEKVTDGTAGTLITTQYA